MNNQSPYFISYAQLRCDIDIQSLKFEINRLLGNPNWISHYSTYDYEGDWTVLSLRSIDGDLTKPYAQSVDSAIFKDTSLLESLPHTKRLLEQFRCEKMSVRLLKLGAGAIIKPHSDIELNFEKGEARIHIPIFTNEQVEFYLLNERVRMAEGECWYINANLEHHVVNNGNSDRVHLVVDCLVNQWLKDLFSVSKKKISFNRINLTESRNIIDSLRLQSNQVATTLANQLTEELKYNDAVDKMLNFLSLIGISYHLEPLSEKTFLPGLLLRKGTLVIDLDQLKYPGDILHEAGHLACMTAEERIGMDGELPSTDLHQGGELAAIAWSYAASLHIGLDPAIVFHADGYKNGSQNLLDNFNSGQYFGVPLLVWKGMTEDKRGGMLDHVFPKMKNWLCGNSSN